MIAIPTYDEIEAQVLAFFRNRFPGRDTHTESFLGKTARVIARCIMYLLVSLQSVDQDAVPSQKTSSARLNEMAAAFGVASNLGGFGPNGAVAASGGVGVFTGTNGQAIPDGALMTAPDGQTIFKLSGAVSIPGTPPGSGSIAGSVLAVTAGSAGNLAAGTQLTLQQPPSGIDAAVTLSSGLAGGLDVEIPQSLLQRILDRWQKPPKGGTANDYRVWAETVVGVARAYVYPKRQGTASVDVVVTAAGSGSGRIPSAAVQTDVETYISGDATANPPVAGQRSVGASAVGILLPRVASSDLLAIRARVLVADSKYAFDWALGAATLTVSAYAGGVITTTEALPSSLTAAIDAYLASPTTIAAPRLQVVATGMASPGIAVPVHAVAYNAVAKTITLESPLPAGWAAPSVGDPVYPYGPAVPIVAAGAVPGTVAGVQGYVDSLGPSRAGGYADPLDVWDDTASVFAVGQVALDATDIDGSRPVKRVLAVTIDGGTADVEAKDTLAGGIELLACGSIAVTD